MFNICNGSFQQTHSVIKDLHLHHVSFKRSSCAGKWKHWIPPPDHHIIIIIRRSLSKVSFICFFSPAPFYSAPPHDVFINILHSAMCPFEIKRYWGRGLVGERRAGGALRDTNKTLVFIQFHTSRGSDWVQFNKSNHFGWRHQVEKIK